LSLFYKLFVQINHYLYFCIWRGRVTLILSYHLWIALMRSELELWVCDVAGSSCIGYITYCSCFCPIYCQGLRIIPICTFKISTSNYYLLFARAFRFSIALLLLLIAQPWPLVCIVGCSSLMILEESYI